MLNKPFSLLSPSLLEGQRGGGKRAAEQVMQSYVNTILSCQQVDHIQHVQLHLYCNTTQIDNRQTGCENTTLTDTQDVKTTLTDNRQSGCEKYSDLQQDSSQTGCENTRLTAGQ